MNKKINFSQLMIDPSDYEFSVTRINYIKTKITDKNTNLTRLATITGISISSLRQFRLDPNKLDKINVQTLKKLEIGLIPFEENKKMLMELGYTDKDIDYIALQPNYFKELVLQRSKLEFTTTDKEANITLMLLNQLFDIFANDSYLQNLILKNVLENLNDLNSIIRNSAPDESRQK